MSLSKRLGLIHTVSRLAPTFADLAADLLPGVEVTVVVDELLLKQTVLEGFVSAATSERLKGHIAALSDYGVDDVLVTCSSIGAVVDQIAADSSVPIYRVDRAMAERAVAEGTKVGVLATLGTTLTPTTDLVRQFAERVGRKIDVVPRLCDGAFDALQRGEDDRHDAIVVGELDRLAERVDVVVLAQASMARIADGRPSDGVPILSSPRLAVEDLADRSRRAA